MSGRGQTGWVGMLAALLLLTGAAQAADDIRLWRIGSGGMGGTYFPIATLIAEAISGSADCAGIDCGVPGLLAVAQVSNGSVTNIRDLAAGHLEAGLAQADAVAAAVAGSGVFTDDGPQDNLRAIAYLYPETVHLVARAGSGIRSVADLAGQRVSLDEPGSGSLLVARLILAAHGLSETDLQAVYLKPRPAAREMQEGRLDAFFVVAGHPVAAVTELSTGFNIELIPLQNNLPASTAGSFFVVTDIPAATYHDLPATPTLAVGALLLTDARQSEEQVYAITQALWSERTQARLRQGHSKGSQIQLQNALNGLSAPLHPGAARFYRQQGLLDDGHD